MFRRLAVFVGGFRLEAAEAVCTQVAAGADVLQMLDSLVGQSLLLRRVDSDGEPRFWMLETIREYAYDRLESYGELETARRLHADWFTTLAEDLDSESRTGDQTTSISRLEEDYANLRAAIGWAHEAGQGELLLRLATALWPFWSTRGYVAEGRKALEDALELDGRRPARALGGLASLRVFCGRSDGLLDDVHDALRVVRGSYAALEAMGERSYLSTAAALQAHALCAQGELDQAESYSRLSEDAAARDDAFSQVLWRAARAKIRARRGQHSEAETLAREAVARVQKTDLLNTQGDTLVDLAEVIALAGRGDEATAVLGQAAELFERKGNVTSLERARRIAGELAASG